MAKCRKKIIWGAGSQAKRLLLDKTSGIQYDDVAFFVDRNKELQNNGVHFFLDSCIKKVIAPEDIASFNHKDYEWVICIARPEAVRPYILSDDVKSYPWDFGGGVIEPA